MHILYSRKLLYICAIAALLSSASVYAFGKPENGADCERIVSEIGWKLENPTMWPQYSVCDAAPPKTETHVQDTKIALRIPSYDGFLLFSTADTSVTAREVLASFIKMREKSVSTRNNIVYLPTEYIEVGDEAVLLLDERKDHMAGLHRLVSSKDSKIIRNYDGGAVSQWSGEVQFVEGRCIARVFGNSLFNTTWEDSTNDPQFFEYYHQYEPVRDSKDEIVIGGGGTIINRHPDFDHGKAALRDLLINEAKKIAAAIKPVCADTAVKTPPVDNTPAPIDWQKCLAQCPVVTASKDCVITPKTRPSEMQCLRDTLRASLACQNTCIEKLPQRECSVDVPPMQFPEINFGGRSYFTSNVNVKNTYIEESLKNSQEREMDLTQAAIESDSPDLKDTNNKTFSDSTNFKTADSDTSKQKNISLDEGARVFKIEGDVEILIPGETEWRTLKRDDIIPAGSRVFTGPDADLLINFPKYGAVKVLSFSDFILDQSLVDESCTEGSRTPLLHHLDLRTGEVEVRVEKGTYQGSMQVTTPSASNGVRGTHFWVSYDNAKNISVTGVYEGTVAVTDRTIGATMNLGPQADGKPGIAILGSMPADATPQPPDESQESGHPGSRILMGIFISIILLVGGAYILHKTGKLQLILQKFKR